MENTAMTTPTKAKGLAFDIEIKNDQESPMHTPNKNTLKTKERLEQRKMLLENSSGEKQIQDVESKIKHANEKRMSGMKQKTETIQERLARRSVIVDLCKSLNEKRIQILKQKMTQSQDEAELRRKLNFEMKMQKVQTQMEKVKTAQMKVASGTAVRATDMLEFAME